MSHAGSKRDERTNDPGALSARVSRDGTHFSTERGLRKKGRGERLCKKLSLQESREKKKKSSLFCNREKGETKSKNKLHNWENN